MHMYRHRTVASMHLYAAPCQMAGWRLRPNKRPSVYAPSCDWFPLGMYALLPPVIGSNSDLSCDWSPARRLGRELHERCRQRGEHRRGEDPSPPLASAAMAPAQQGHPRLRAFRRGEVMRRDAAAAGGGQ
eukprot:5120206-Pyramimonas_sp.AAC.1